MEFVPEQLKCPACFEIPSCEIHQCRNGHILCNKCSSNLLLCPQCQIHFETPKIRNMALEELIDSDVVRVVCPHNLNGVGCKEKLKLKELRNHSLICRHNPYCTNFCERLGFHQCSYILNTSTRFDAALHHFKAKHGFIIKTGCDEVMLDIQNLPKLLKSNVDKGLWTPVILKFPVTQVKGAVGNFIVLTMFNGEDKTLSIICVSLGVPDTGLSTATEYVAHVLLFYTGTGVGVETTKTEMEALEWIVPTFPLLKSTCLLAPRSIRVSTAILFPNGFSDHGEHQIKAFVMIRRRIFFMPSIEDLKFKALKTEPTRIDLVNLDTTWKPKFYVDRDEPGAL